MTARAVPVAPAPPVAPPVAAPVTRFTVLYDADCPLCTWVRGWLEGRPQYVPLDFVPLGSAQARAAFPGLDHDRTRDEVTVVADTGEVWTADGAWLAVLWATVDYRSLAERLSGPQARGQVRRVALSLAASRMGRPAPPACTPAGACPLPAQPPPPPSAPAPVARSAAARTGARSAPSHAPADHRSGGVPAPGTVVTESMSERDGRG